MFAPDVRYGVIAVFAKQPLPGRVKTRLATAIGPNQAAAFARAFLDDTCALMDQVRGAERALVTEGELEAPPRFERWPQASGPLGHRLERAFADALVRWPWAIIMGADSPGLPLVLVDECVTALRTSDTALIPAADGGYCAIGTRRPLAGALVDNIRFSSEHALADTLARLRDAGLSVRTTAPWFDVDTLADLEHLEALLARNAVLAPATAAELARFRAGR